jgi:transcriptional regulator of acetoin/glycerol metabolism
MGAGYHPFQGFKCVILAAGGSLSFDLPSNNGLSNTHEQQPRTVGTLSSVHTIEDIQTLEKELIMTTLEACEGRISGPFGAAKKLEINSQTLYSRIRKYKLS